MSIDLQAMAQNIRNKTIEEIAIKLKELYPDNVSTNAFCATIRSMEEMTNKQAEINNYKMNSKPDVIKAAVSMGTMDRDVRQKLVETSDLQVTRDRMSNVYEREVWNGAIGACQRQFVDSYRYNGYDIWQKLKGLKK